LGETNGDAFAIFDLLTGTVGDATAGVTRSIAPVGNGWYRCTATFTSSGGGTQQIGFGLSNTNTAVNPPATAGIDTFLWGAQLEVGSFPTSYIPTTTAPLARGADVSGPIVDAGALNINQQEGTLLIEFTRELTGSTSLFKSPLRIWASSAISDYAGIDFHDSLLRSPLRTSNTTVFTNTVADAVLGGRKMAFSWKSGSSAFVIDSVVLATTAATFAFPSVLDTLGFAGIPNAPYNGRIASIRYYKKRLPNAKLQALTV
jgi:hypothetical protein